MNLIFDIALTHLRGRLRQSVVAIAGIATGVGFSVGMASLMEGSQKDFIDTIIDATPHIVIKDEFREPRRQPVAELFPGGAVALRGVKPKEELRGIRNAKARLAEMPPLATPLSIVATRSPGRSTPCSRRNTGITAAWARPTNAPARKRALMRSTRLSASTPTRLPNVAYVAISRELSALIPTMLPRKMAAPTPACGPSVAEANIASVDDGAR